jgi:hypothetical protein
MFRFESIKECIKRSKPKTEKIEISIYTTGP